MIRVAPSVLLLSFPLVLRLVFWSVPSAVLPSLGAVALGIPAAFLLRAIHNPYSRFALALWLTWWCIGSLNLLGSYVTVGNYYAIDVDQGIRVYMLFADVYALGLWLSERIVPAPAGFGPSLRSIRDDLPRTFRFALMSFPFAWVASMYVTLGYVPLAKGEDITFEMYAANYGVLYGFTAVISVAVGYAVYQALQRTGTDRARWLGYALLAIVLSVADGKRFVALIAGMASFVFLAHHLQRRTWRALPGLVFAAMGLYVGIALVRQGLDASAHPTDLYARLAMIGVEFRDFALSMEMFRPGQVPGYAWASSALAAMVNGKLLALLGMNKSALVQSGSAYVWMKVFGTGLGIRTGVVSELWFAYGWLGCVPMLLFGVGSGLIAGWIVRARTLSSLLFGAQIYALAVLEINGQTTAATGTIAVLAYLWLLFALLRGVERNAAPGMAASMIGPLRVAAVPRLDAGPRREVHPGEDREP